MTVEQVEIVNLAAICCILKCIGRTLNDTVDTAEEGGLERVEAEALDKSMQGKYPICGLRLTMLTYCWPIP